MIENINRLKFLVNILNKEKDSELSEEVNTLFKKLKKESEITGLSYKQYKEPKIELLKTKNITPNYLKELDILNDPVKPTNYLLEGDNYYALTALQDNYSEKVDVIYIDPPYNTGNKTFIYNDSYTNLSVENKHSKWLSFMEKRLTLARKLLTSEGVIFISIDDNEQANLKLLCDTIFGESNFIANIPRMTSPQRKSQEKFVSTQHDYILIYKKSDLKGFERITPKKHKNKLKKDNIGHYYDGDSSAILASNRQGYSKGGDYDFMYKGFMYKPETASGVRRRWLWSYERMKAAANLGILVASDRGLRYRNYLDKSFQVGTNIMVDKNPNMITSTNDFMSSDYSSLIGERILKDLNLSFDFSKPVSLIKELVKLHPNKNAIVLDFFAGSGTTGQAVMELNKEDGGNRQFILATNNEVSETKGLDLLINRGYIDEKPLVSKGQTFKNWKISIEEFKKTAEYVEFIDSEAYQKLGIARSVTYERLSKIINGYTTPKGKEIEGLSNNLKYIKFEVTKE